MSSLALTKTSDPFFRARWDGLREKLGLEVLLEDGGRLEQVRGILAQVRSGGDAAVAELTAKFDGVRLAGKEFRIGADKLREAHGQLDDKLRKALQGAIANVRSYQQAIKMKGPDDWGGEGVRLGVRYRPLRRVGVCVPGASAPLVSTVIMSAVPAQVAGVEQIVVVSSPSYEGSIHPAILAVCYELGIEQVYRISGAQAVAALAYGTESIGKVDKIVGPSSVWAQLAKKELFGVVDIDSFAGPSDVLIVADETARAEWVAADMLSQAEHAPGSAVLLTDSARLAESVVEQVEVQLAQLSRGELTRTCVEESCLAVVTRDMDEAIELANEFGPEHLQVQCRQSEAVVERLANAGAIFVGDHTPVAVGDYFAGPSHVLPTGGTARIFGPLNVNDFLKQTSIVSYDAKALRQAAEPIETIAEAEGLDGHARSVRVRLQE